MQNLKPEPRMALMDMIFTVSVVSAMNVIFGIFWYSSQCFGRAWIDYYFGGAANYERVRTKYAFQSVMLISTLSVVCYNALLVFLVGTHVFVPQSLWEVTMVSVILCSIYMLFELAHVSFENRSYGALMVHVGFHLAQTFMSLWMCRFFFKIPKHHLDL